MKKKFVGVPGLILLLIFTGVISTSAQDNKIKKEKWHWDNALK